MRAVKFILILLFSSYSLADMLFIDFNNVDAEVQIARKEAERRRERFILLPKDRDAIKRDFATSLKKQNEVDQFEIDRKMADCFNEEKRFSTQCVALQSKSDQLSFQIENSPKPNYDIEAFKKDLADLPKDSKISTMLVSGHDGEASFYGNFGKVTSDEMLEALKSTPQLKDTKSIFALGCLSATQHSFGSVWKAALPKVQLVAGYENTGYLRTNPEGHKFIQNLLKNEPILLASQSIAEAQKVLKGFAPLNKEYGAAACLMIANENIYLSSTSAPGKLESLMDCDGKKKQLAAAMDFLKCVKSKNSEEQNMCQFDSVKGFSLDSLSGCRFSFERDFMAAMQLKEDFYVLQMLIDNPRYNLAALFKSVDPNIFKALRLDEPVLTYGDAKKKFLSIKQAYERKSEFENLQKLTPTQMEKFSSEKNYFDQAWLAVSNWDMQAMAKLSERSSIGGLLRAESFFAGLDGSFGTKSQQIDARISRLRSEESAAGPKDKSFYKQEIESLQRYRDVNQQNSQ